MNGSTVVPNLDSIAGFKVLTANLDAENGNYTAIERLLIEKAA